MEGRHVELAVTDATSGIFLDETDRAVQLFNVRGVEQRLGHLGILGDGAASFGSSVRQPSERHDHRLESGIGIVEKMDGDVSICFR